MSGLALVFALRRLHNSLTIALTVAGYWVGTLAVLSMISREAQELGTYLFSSPGATILIGMVIAISGAFVATIGIGVGLAIGLCVRRDVRQHRGPPSTD